MKIRLAAVALLLMTATSVWAQETKVQDPDKSAELNTQAYIQLLRSNLATKKTDIVKETMQLNSQQAAAFWPIYNEYQAAQSKLIDEKLAIVTEYARDFSGMTDEKADQLAQQVMQFDEKRMALREKYYAILKKAIPATLAVRFFQVENQLQLIVDLQIAANLPIIEAANAQ